MKRSIFILAIITNVFHLATIHAAEQSTAVDLIKNLTFTPSPMTKTNKVVYGTKALILPTLAAGLGFATSHYTKNATIANNAPYIGLACSAIIGLTEFHYGTENTKKFATDAADDTKINLFWDQLTKPNRAMLYLGFLRNRDPSYNEENGIKLHESIVKLGFRSNNKEESLNTFSNSSLSTEEATFFSAYFQHILEITVGCWQYDNNPIAHNAQSMRWGGIISTVAAISGIAGIKAFRWWKSI